jgi:hypothetical protein
MRSFQRKCAVAAASVLCVALAAPAPAQDLGTIPVPLVEISGGYMFMRETSSDFPGGATNFPVGWYFSGALNPTEFFGLVGEVSGSAKTNFDVSMSGYTFSNDARVFTFLGGPRFFKKIGRVVPYGQFLAGVAHLRLDTQLPAALLGTTMTIKGRSTNVAIQPGGGVTVYVTDRIGVRAGADFRSILDFVTDGPNDYTNELRFVTGFVVQWGR